MTQEGMESVESPESLEAVDTMEPLDAVAYLAAPGFEDLLCQELEGILEVHERLLVASGPRQPARWAQNIWLRPLRIPIRSVTDGARKLRAIQRNWALYSPRLHRRSRLIEEKLPHVSMKPLAFPCLPPSAPLGSWSLIEKDVILASARCTSPFANGEARFAEFREGPPTRAYLKLWEAFTLLGKWPAPSDRCLDAGASPGGWTWALARLGAQVLAVDRAPLAPSVAKLPGVACRRGSAFALRPGEAGPFDWILSDVVCYPERLWEWVKPWIDSSPSTSFVCTVKFQGRALHRAIEAFAAVPGSQVFHLWANKHELTWCLLRGRRGGAGPGKSKDSSRGVPGE